MALRKKRRRRRRCRFCGQLFNVDPRLKERHYACSERKCQRERKKANQQRWLLRNPDYFKGRYPTTKTWLDFHPSYQAHYRRAHPEKVHRDNAQRKRRHLIVKTTHADIQLAKSLQKPVTKILTPTLNASHNADIQAPILSQIIMISAFSATYLKRVRADIQESIHSQRRPWYAPRHELSQQIPAAPGSNPQGSQLL